MEESNSSAGKRTGADRQRDFAERQKAAGYKRTTVWIHEETAKEGIRAARAGNFYLLDCCYSFVNSLYRLTVLLYQIVDSYRVSEHTLCGLGFFLRPYCTYRVLPHAKRDDLSRRSFIL